MHISLYFSLAHKKSLETLGSWLEFKTKLSGFEHELVHTMEVMMDLPKSPWGKSGWKKSIEACNWAVACVEELHRVLSNEHIQREAADSDTARKICEVLSERCNALLIRQTHASLGQLPCLYTHAWEQRQISYCSVGKHQDKMTWPRFDSFVSLHTHRNPVPSYFCSFKLLSKWAPG